MRGLVLDYGEVLSRPQRPDAMQDMARALGVSGDALAAAYWRLRREYDTGLPARDYWSRALASLGLVLDAETFAILVEHDVRSWTDYRPEMWALVDRFRAAGGRTAFLSNGVPEIMARIRRERDLTAHFDAVVVSCEVGLAKPEPAIFQLTLDRLGVGPADTLFVDDREENVAAAAALGLHTVRFSGDSSVDEVARRLGLV